MFLIPASSLQLIWGSELLSTVSYLQLVWNSCHRGYIIIWPPLFFLRASQFRTQFNPTTVKVISWYSSTGCTCYLHRCIFIFWQLGRVGGQYTTQVFTPLIIFQTYSLVSNSFLVLLRYSVLVFSFTIACWCTLLYFQELVSFFFSERSDFFLIW